MTYLLSSPLPKYDSTESVRISFLTAYQAFLCLLLETYIDVSLGLRFNWCLQRSNIQRIHVTVNNFRQIFEISSANAT